MAAETHETTRPLMPLSGWLALVVFLVGIGGALYLWWHETQSNIRIPVPVRDLPMYYQIQPNDLVQRTHSSRQVTSTTLRETTQIVGRYTLVEVPQGKPLNDVQLGPGVNTMLISNTVAIGIPATTATVLGGNLQAGDVVDLFFAPVASEGQFSLTPPMFENLLVLDVKTVIAEKAADGLQPHPSYVVVIALPIDRRGEFVSHGASETMWLTRRNRP
jgi:Flp pilus assembly protein CpaB